MIACQCKGFRTLILKCFWSRLNFWSFYADIHLLRKTRRWQSYLLIVVPTHFAYSCYPPSAIVSDALKYVSTTSSHLLPSIVIEAVMKSMEEYRLVSQPVLREIFLHSFGKYNKPLKTKLTAFVIPFSPLGSITSGHPSNNFFSFSISFFSLAEKFRFQRQFLADCYVLFIKPTD